MMPERKCYFEHTMSADSLFDHAFKFSEFELQYLKQSLERFFDERWITRILRNVKGGKEATVYLCQAHPATGLQYIAAKVYRPREHRAMANYDFYRSGQNTQGRFARALRGSRAQRAVLKNSKAGQSLEHTAWLAHEFNLLARLHGKGVSIPEPFAVGNNALLMEFIGDDEFPAPLLQSIRLPKDEARAHFKKILEEMRVMLSLGIIHADLSPYNILFHKNKTVLIDFPQAVDANMHEAAYALLLRDMTKVCKYFSNYGPGYDAEKYTSKIWKKSGPYPLHSVRNVVEDIAPEIY